MEHSPRSRKTVETRGSEKKAPSRFRWLESKIRKVSYPLLGILVCLQILIQLPQITEVRSFNPEIERIRLKNGGGLLQVKIDHTYTTSEFKTTPFFQEVYGEDYLVIHHQIVSFLGECGAIQYVQFPSDEKAKQAQKRVEDSWDYERPMTTKVYDNLLVRVTGPDVVFLEYSKSVFAKIERNLESKGE